MPFLRFLGTWMSDEVPITASGAVRAYLGALGFIVALIGAEMIAEKDGSRLYLGVGLVLTSLPIFLSVALWGWIQKKISRQAVTMMVRAAKDPLWWAMTLFAAVTLLGPRWFGPEWAYSVGAGIIVGWFFYTWPRRKDDSETAAVKPLASEIDNQTHLDLIHLLDFALVEASFQNVERLLETSKSPAVAGEIEKSAEDAHEARGWFIGYVRQELGNGTHRQNAFINVMHSAEGEAERELEATPPQERPTDIDPLALRRYRIRENQFRRALQFLEGQRVELKASLAGARHQLAERSRERSAHNGS